MLRAIMHPCDHRIQPHVVNRLKNALVHIRVGFFQLRDELLYLRAFRGFCDFRVIRQRARALQEFE
jgi:hypothetical protein